MTIVLPPIHLLLSSRTLAKRKHFNNTYSLHINYPSYSYVELLDTYHDNDIIKKYDFIN